MLPESTAAEVQLIFSMGGKQRESEMQKQIRAVATCAKDCVGFRLQLQKLEVAGTSDIAAVVQKDIKNAMMLQLCKYRSDYDDHAKLVSEALADAAVDFPWWESVHEKNLSTLLGQTKVKDYISHHATKMAQSLEILMKKGTSTCGNHHAPDSSWKKGLGPDPSLEDVLNECHKTCGTVPGGKLASHIKELEEALPKSVSTAVHSMLRYPVVQ